MPLHACHDCAHPTPHRKYCDACTAAYKATDGRADAAARARTQRPERGQHARKRALRAQVLADHGHECGRCHQPIEPGQAWELGHVVPHAHGGPFTRTNLRPEHKTCNRRGGTR